MSILTIAWSMCASACAVMALTHLFLWLKDREKTAYILASVMAGAAAANGLLELALLHCTSVERYAALLKIESVSVYLVLIPMVWFINLYFGTARRWLAWVITGLWSAALLFNFLSPASLVYTEITEIHHHQTFWGEGFQVARGAVNPWKILADIASLLIAIYVVDATFRLWRKGDRRKAWVLGGSIAAFITVGGIHSPLVDAGVIQTPYMVVFAFLFIVLAMTYDVASEAILSSRYALRIKADEERWRSLMDNVDLLVVGIDKEGLIDYANASFIETTGTS